MKPSHGPKAMLKDWLKRTDDPWSPLSLDGHKTPLANTNGDVNDLLAGSSSGPKVKL